MRYDLALRQPDGSLRVFYGVTADGMIGPWQQFLRAEDKVNGEAESHPAVEAAPQAADEADAPTGPAEAKPTARSRRGRGRSKSEPAAAAQTRVAMAEPPTVRPADVTPKPKSRWRSRTPKPEAQPEPAMPVA